MYCQKCGADNKTDDQFCGNCGNILTSTTTTPRSGPIAAGGPSVTGQSPLKDSGAVTAMSVVGFVFGLIGMMGSFIPCIGSLAFYIGIPAAIISGIALGVANSQGAKKSFAIVALTISLIGVTISGWQYYSIISAGNQAERELKQMFKKPSYTPPTQAPIPPIIRDQPKSPDRSKITNEIAQLEESLKNDPGNSHAWVQLGNNYFDLGVAQKSVDAYSKALAIMGDNPDVLTDQGNMYRKLKDFPKAVAAFRKAAASSPNHRQSRLMLGVVLMDDLNDPQGALAPWEEFLRLAPNEPNAVDIRRKVEQIRGKQSE